MAMRYSLILKAVDKLSAPAKKMQRSIERLTAPARKLGEQIKKATREVETGARSLEHYQRRAQRLRRVALGRTFQAAAASAQKLARNLRDLPRRLKLVERAGQAAGRGLKWLGGKALDMAKWGAAGATAAGGWAIFDMFKTASQFEQFQIMLEGTEGSAKKAKQSMAWVKRFARETPYELEQVMAAFVQLRAYGIDPTDGTLRSLGDGASSMNKELMQAVEALADAQTGEFERLKEFAIRSRVEGDKVTFTYLKNGKEIRKVARNSASDIKSALTGIFSDRFGGGMKRQSKTFAGLIANLKDMWSDFQMRVADAGIFDKVKAKAAQLLKKVEELARNGTLDRWAQRISDRLGDMFDAAVKFIEETDWGSVAKGMGAIVNVLLKIIGLIGKAASKWEEWQRARERATLEKTANSWAPWVSKQTKAAARGRLNRMNVEDYIERQRGKRDPRGWNLKGRKTSSLPRPAVGPDAQAVKVSGKTEIDVRVHGPASARLSKVRQTGDVPMKVNLGRSMGEAA